MEILNLILASQTSICVKTVPDSGATAILLGVGIISLGALARFIKRRK